MRASLLSLELVCFLFFVFFIKVSLHISPAFGWRNTTHLLDFRYSHMQPWRPLLNHFISLNIIVCIAVTEVGTRSSLICRLRGRLVVPRRDTHSGINNDSLVLILHVVSIVSMFLALSSVSLQSTDLGIERKLCIWLPVCSSEVGNVCRFTMNICPSKQTLDERKGVTGVFHTHWHDKDTEACSQTCTQPHSVSMHILTLTILTNRIKKKCMSFYLHYRILHTQRSTPEQTKLTHDYACWKPQLA